MNERLSKIAEIVSKRDVYTQKQLTSILREEGFDVTQATVSRDIQKLGLKKVNSEGGKKYELPAKTDKSHGELPGVFKDGVVKLETAGNLAVIKTHNGMAMAVCAALDGLELPDVIGTVAGDDTIFCAVKTPEKAEKLIVFFKETLI